MGKTIHTKRHDRFCRLLVEARSNAGLTQAAVAAKLRRPQSFVSKCETGERRLDIVELIDFANAINFDLIQFIRTLRHEIR